MNAASAFGGMLSHWKNDNAQKKKKTKALKL